MCKFCDNDPQAKADNELADRLLGDDQKEELLRLVFEGVGVVNRIALEKRMLGDISDTAREAGKDYLKRMKKWKEDILSDPETSPELAELLFRKLPSFDQPIPE